MLLGSSFGDGNVGVVVGIVVVVVISGGHASIAQEEGDGGSTRFANVDEGEGTVYVGDFDSMGSIDEFVDLLLIVN